MKSILLDILAVFATLVSVVLTAGCASGAAARGAGSEALVYYLIDAPVIDGSFDEWDGLQGVVTQIAVFGGSHEPEDAEGRFVLATDGLGLYILADVTDDVPNENELPAPLAWRNDSVEIFFGTDLSRHTSYAMGDSQIRLVPVDKEDPYAFEVSVNDVVVSEDCEAAVEYRDNGYRIEAYVPFEILLLDGLEPGQRIRAEFQVNDGDDTERDRLLHWVGTRDNPWNDASAWGDGRVLDVQ